MKIKNIIYLSIVLLVVSGCAVDINEFQCVDDGVCTYQEQLIGNCRDCAPDFSVDESSTYASYFFDSDRGIWNVEARFCIESTRDYIGSVHTLWALQSGYVDNNFFDSQIEMEPYVWWVNNFEQVTQQQVYLNREEVRAHFSIDITPGTLFQSLYVELESAQPRRHCMWHVFEDVNPDKDISLIFEVNPDRRIYEPNFENNRAIHIFDLTESYPDVIIEGQIGTFEWQRSSRGSWTNIDQLVHTSYRGNYINRELAQNAFVSVDIGSRVVDNLIREVEDMTLQDLAYLIGNLEFVPVSGSTGYYIIRENSHYSETYMWISGTDTVITIELYGGLSFDTSIIEAYLEKYPTTMINFVAVHVNELELESFIIGIYEQDTPDSVINAVNFAEFYTRSFNLERSNSPTIDLNLNFSGSTVTPIQARAYLFSELDSQRQLFQNEPAILFVDDKIVVVMRYPQTQLEEMQLIVLDSLLTIFAQRQGLDLRYVELDAVVENGVYNSIIDLFQPIEPVVVTLNYDGMYRWNEYEERIISGKKFTFANFGPSYRWDNFTPEFDSTFLRINDLRVDLGMGNNVIVNNFRVTLANHSYSRNMDYNDWNWNRYEGFATLVVDSDTSQGITRSISTRADRWSGNIYYNNNIIFVNVRDYGELASGEYFIEIYVSVYDRFNHRSQFNNWLERVIRLYPEQQIFESFDFEGYRFSFLSFEADPNNQDEYMLTVQIMDVKTPGQREFILQPPVGTCPQGFEQQEGPYFGDLCWTPCAGQEPPQNALKHSRFGGFGTNDANFFGRVVTIWTHVDVDETFKFMQSDLDNEIAGCEFTCPVGTSYSVGTNACVPLYN